MRLVKDNSPGAWAVSVPCVGERHHEMNERTHGHRHANTMFTLAEGYADLDGKAFVDYYCDACAASIPALCPCGKGISDCATEGCCGEESNV